MAWRRLARAASAVGFAALGASAVPWPAASLAEAAEEQPGRSGDRLRLVQVVFRHGARTPLSKRYWPELVDAWDVCGQEYEPVAVAITTEGGLPRPVNSHDRDQMATRYAGGCVKGELTRDGQRQARSFGAWLRQRYVQQLGFLPEEHRGGSLASRSTNYSRTVATLRGVLTGLYPGAKSQFPVETTEELDEILFGNQHTCERLAHLIRAGQQAASAALPPPEVQALQERVRTALGLERDAPINFLDLHDAMTTMRQHGKRIPEGMRDEALLAAVELQAVQQFLNFVAPPGDAGRKQEVLRLGMGRLMWLMLQRMEAEVATGGEAAAATRPRAYLYSGHDSTIMPLLAALGKEVDHWPPYLSNFVFELWECPGGEPYVRVLYNQQVLPLTELCGRPNCTLRELRDTVLEPMLLSSREERERGCKVHFSHDLPAGENVQSGSAVVGD